MDHSTEQGPLLIVIGPRLGTHPNGLEIGLMHQLYTYLRRKKLVGIDQGFKMIIQTSISIHRSVLGRVLEVPNEPHMQKTHVGARA